MDHKPNYFWTNSIIIENTGKDEDLVSFNNFDNNRAFTFNNFRLNDGNDNSNDFESNFIKNFNDKGILTADGSFTKSNDKEDSFINELIPPSLKNSVTTTLNDEVQEQFQFQADYVLPIERRSV
jgi:hypothetical protein